MNDVMVDLETLGTSNNAPILSIGAVQFNLDTGETGKDFYREIDIAYYDEQPDFKMDYMTVKWWFDQSKEAQKVFLGKHNLFHVLKEFSDFYTLDCKGKTLWGNGSNFDNVILRNAYKSYKLTPPWQHWEDRDVRTIVHLGRLKGIEKKKDAKVEGIEHNALDDSRKQVKYCTEIWKQIKG